MNTRFNYNYAKIMMMKMFLARPDYPHNTSEVLINFENALKIIRCVDNITQGIGKIVYLVGWQGLGHDDLYPDMTAVNDHLKRDCDPDGRSSLLWLIEEAKKYNTVVSFHGNLADAYEQSPSFPELAAANAVTNDKNGKPAVIEIFNGRNAYKVSYKQYYESGLFKKYWDKFCDLVPVKEAGTVHLDNFCIAENLCPETGMAEQNDARNAMIDYITSLGIDVTSEYTYRELDRRADDKGHPIHKYYGDDVSLLPENGWKNAPIHTIGRIPAVWWMSNMQPGDFMTYPPEVFTGFPTDEDLRYVFYGLMHGEDIWMENGHDEKEWSDEFIKQFCLIQVPYFYLNRYRRERLEKHGDGSFTGYFSDGVKSDGKTKTITKNGVTVKDGENALLLPLGETGRKFIAYSENGKTGKWDIPDAEDGEASVFRITPDGNVPAGKTSIRGGKVTLSVGSGEAYALITE